MAAGQLQLSCSSSYSTFPSFLLTAATPTPVPILGLRQLLCCGRGGAAAFMPQLSTAQIALQPTPVPLPTQGLWGCCSSSSSADMALVSGRGTEFR